MQKLSLMLSILVFANAAQAQPGQAPAQPAWDETTSIEANYLKNIRQVTFDFEKAGEGYFSPDGKTIVYQAVRVGYPFYQIFTQPLEGREARMISTGRGRTTCAYFSPDGKKVIFASSHLDPNLEETEKTERAALAAERESGQRRRYSWPFDPQMDIYEANPDGSELKRLTDAEGYDAECAYSPDGKHIVFCSTRDGSPNLYIMDADGGNVRQLTDTKAYDGGPFFSPDGKRIVFRADREQENYLQIFVIGTDGKNETQLTRNEGVNWAPYWHPTLPYIIWTGADHANPRERPNYDLWLMRYEIEGDTFHAGKPIRLTDHPSADVLPVFSPDGKQLMWTSGRAKDGTSQLWIADFMPPEEKQAEGE